MADKQDALLLVQLHEQWSTTGVAEAAGWLHANEPFEWADFNGKFANDSKEYGYLSAYLRYHETVATLWKNGLFDEKLLFDWLWLWGSWDLVKPLAFGMREHYGVPAMWENFEAAAEAQRASDNA